MTFAKLPLHASVFVDANVLVFRYSPHHAFHQPCKDLLERIERQEVAGHTSTHVIGEAAHRLMTLEAITLFGWPQAGIGNRLRSNPAEVTKLTAFRLAMEEILQSRIQVLTVTASMLLQTLAIAQQAGLLTNDALVVSLMRHHGLTNLASSDADFDRVPGLTRYTAS